MDSMITWFIKPRYWLKPGESLSASRHRGPQVRVGEDPGPLGGVEIEGGFFHEETENFTDLEWSKQQKDGSPARIMTWPTQSGRLTQNMLKPHPELGLKNPKPVIYWCICPENMAENDWGNHLGSWSWNHWVHLPETMIGIGKKLFQNGCHGGCQNEECDTPNIYITIEHHHFKWVNQLKIAMFNSYVSLPEGTSTHFLTCENRT